jgi:hypothetical protein
LGTIFVIRFEIILGFDQILHRMKRIFFSFSLLLLLLTGFAGLQAQSAVATSPVKQNMTPFEAYKMNFTKAVNEGNLTMVEPHRMKLVSHMEREVNASEATVAASGRTDKAAAESMARQKDILNTFKTMDLSSAAAVEAAKSKLALIDEFGKIADKMKPSTN